MSDRKNFRFKRMFGLFACESNPCYNVSVVVEEVFIIIDIIGVFHTSRHQADLAGPAFCFHFYQGGEDHED